MEIPEELKQYNNLSDEEQQARAMEIAETIERLAATGRLGNISRR